MSLLQYVAASKIILDEWQIVVDLGQRHPIWVCTLCSGLSVPIPRVIMVHNNIALSNELVYIMLTMYDRV